MTNPDLSTPRDDDELYPAHIRDNPIMQIAFRDFMDWIWREDGAHEAHCKATGMAPLATGSPIDAMIDKATGHGDAYARSFVDWAIKTQWGEEETL